MDASGLVNQRQHRSARVNKFQVVYWQCGTHLALDVVAIRQQKTFSVRMVAFMIFLEVADSIFNRSRLWSYMLRLTAGGSLIALFVQTFFNPLRATAGLAWRATNGPPCQTPRLF